MTNTGRFNPGFYDESDLCDEGFVKIGHNVKISKNCTIIGAENISIGDNVRIDGYTSIFATGEKVTIGSYVHIGSYCHISGGSGIDISDFAGLSQGVCLYSRTDDYTGAYLTNPMVPEKYTGITEGKIIIGRHVIIGAGSIVMPGVSIGEGASVGALSLVTKSLESWGVYFGCPVKKLKKRNKKLLELEKMLLEEKKYS